MDKPIPLAHRGEFWAMQWTGDNLDAFKAWLEPLECEVEVDDRFRAGPALMLGLAGLDDEVWVELHRWAVVAVTNGVIASIEEVSKLPLESHYRRLGETRVIEGAVTLAEQDYSDPLVFVGLDDIAWEVRAVASDKDTSWKMSHRVRVTIERIDDE